MSKTEGELRKVPRMRAGRTLCPSDIESHFFLRGMKSLSALFFSRLLVLALAAQSVAGEVSQQQCKAAGPCLRGSRDPVSGGLRVAHLIPLCTPHPLRAPLCAGCRYGVALSSAGFIQHSVDLSTAENVISDGSGPQCVQVLPGQSLTQFLLQRASACRFSGSGCSAFTLTAQPGEQVGLGSTCVACSSTYAYQGPRMHTVRCVCQCLPAGLPILPLTQCDPQSSRWQAD